MSAFLGTMTFAYLALFPILNPPAMAPIYFQMTALVPEEQRHHLAFLIGVYTFCFLTTLLFVGGWILKVLGISIPVVSIAGGLLVFHAAWHMLNRDPSLSESETEDLQAHMLDKAFFPLTFPVTAGPGAIAVTLSLVPGGGLLEVATILKFFALSCGIAMAAFTVFLFYRYSGNLLKHIGKTGSATISQVSAFILLAIGVQIVWGGLKELLHTLK
jgi:multiple antibiotic resistance protein